MKTQQPFSQSPRPMDDSAPALAVALDTAAIDQLLNEIRPTVISQAAEFVIGPRILDCYELHETVTGKPWRGIDRAAA